MAEPTGRTAASWHTPDPPYTVHADAALVTGEPPEPRRAAGSTRSRCSSGWSRLAVAVLAVVAPAILAAIGPALGPGGAAVVVGVGALLATVRRRR